MNFEMYDIAIIPVIVALVEIIKKIGVPTRYVPIITLVLGQAGAFLYVSQDWRESILVGLVMAFSAMGLWSGAKNTIEKI